MPQWRKLWIKTTDSLDVNAMPNDFVRLAWVLLPLVLDKEGRGLDNLAWLRSNLFPLREDVKLDQIAEAMDWWAARGMIERYNANGRAYFWVPSFSEHQGLRTKEADSRIPPPPSLPSPPPLPEQVQDDEESDDDPDADQVSDQVVDQVVDQLHDQSCTRSGLDIDIEVDLEVDVEVEAEAERARARAPNPAATALTPEQELALEQLLTVPGMDPATARKLVPRFDLAAVPGWVAAGRRAPPEFAAPLVISRLRDGVPPPRARDGPNVDDWSRFVTGEYAEYVST